MYVERLWAIGLGLLPFCAAAQEGMSLTWTQPTTNTDGSPLTNLAGYKVYWGAAPGSYSNSFVLSGPQNAYRIQPLGPGTWYAAVAALNTASAESMASNVVSKAIAGPPPTPPGPVSNLVVTPIATPPPGAVTVTVSGANAGTGEFDVAITGSGPVTMALPGGGLFDWCDPDGEGGLGGSNQTPTTPALGGNNDGIRALSVTLTAPVTTRCDADTATGGGYTFGGATVTVGGLNKPLVQSGSTWAVTF